MEDRSEPNGRWGVSLESLTDTENEPGQNKRYGKPFPIRYEVIKDTAGVREALHLRYVAYRYVNFIEPNMDLIDVDPYDYYSTFLGAYHSNGNGDTLIGTMRIISRNEISPTAPNLKSILTAARDPKIREMGERPELFPMIESFDLPDRFTARNESSKAGKPKAPAPYEISRLAVRPDYWMRNIDEGLHFLMIMDSLLREPNRELFMIAIHPRNRRRYERLGLSQIQDTGEILYKKINQLAIAMYVDMATLLEEGPNYRSFCETTLSEYEEKGFFTRTVEKRLPPRQS